MIDIRLFVHKSKIGFKDEPPFIPSGCVNAVTCLFLFDLAWDGFEKTAVFESAYGICRAPIEDGKCEVPNSIVEHESSVFVGVIGVKEGITVTTDKACFYIAEGTSKDDAEAPEHTETFLEQVLQVMEETKAIAQSVRDDADAGKFNGESADAATDEEVEEMLDEVFGETADTDIPEDSFATDEEVDEMLNEVFESASGESGGGSSAGGTSEDEDFATDEEVDEMLNEVFGTI